VLGSAPAPRGSYTTQVTSTGNQTCFSWGGIVTSTLVNDSDNDGILNIWESDGIHLNRHHGDGLNATFGGCTLAQTLREPSVNLPAMGALNGVKDIFLQIDAMHGTGDGTGGIDGRGTHDHMPPLETLTRVATAFAQQGIALHFDAGNVFGFGETPPSIPGMTP